MNKSKRLASPKFEKVDYGKVPPQDISIEEAVLGSIILENNSNYFHLLKPEVFYKESHQRIYRAIEALHNKRHPIDMLTLINQLKVMDLIEEVGGAFAISNLLNKIASSSNIEYHIRILLQHYYKRELIRLSSAIQEGCFDESTDVFEMLDEQKQMLSSIMSDEITTPSKTMKDVSVSTLEEIFLFDAGKIKTFFKTGNPVTDNLLMFSRGIYLMAGGGGIGKTSYTIWFMNSLLRHNPDASVLWICIDHETGNSINRKFMSIMTNLTDNQLQSKNYKLTELDLHMVTSTQVEIKKWDIEFVEKPLNIRAVEGKFKTFVRGRSKERFMILIIDNVMRLTDNLTTKFKTDTDDFIANVIANIHKDSIDDGYNVAVLFLHHMTKEQMAAANQIDAYRPTIDMIKGSSRYVDIAETVLLLNRPGHYPKLLAEYENANAYLKKVFIIDVAKNTFGETGTLHYLSNLAHVRFKEI